MTEIEYFQTKMCEAFNIPSEIMYTYSNDSATPIEIKYCSWLRKTFIQPFNRIEHSHIVLRGKHGRRKMHNSIQNMRYRWEDIGFN